MPTTLATLPSIVPSLSTTPDSTPCAWVDGRVMNSCFPWPSRIPNSNTLPISAPSTLLTPLPNTDPFPDFPILNQPHVLTPPFIAPHLVVPINSSDPNITTENQYLAQLSSTQSTLFVFNIGSELGRTCNLVFTLPSHLNLKYIALYTFLSPGGIRISRLDRLSDGRANRNSGGTTDVGSILEIIPGNKYTIGSAPCEARQTVGYRIDSTGGLDLQFFQMTSPALGFFIEIA